MARWFLGPVALTLLAVPAITSASPPAKSDGVQCVATSSLTAPQRERASVARVLLRDEATEYVCFEAKAEETRPADTVAEEVPVAEFIAKEAAETGVAPPPALANVPDDADPVGRIRPPPPVGRRRPPSPFQ